MVKHVEIPACTILHSSHTAHTHTQLTHTAHKQLTNTHMHARTHIHTHTHTPRMKTHSEKGCHSILVHSYITYFDMSETIPKDLPIICYIHVKGTTSFGNVCVHKHAHIYACRHECAYAADKNDILSHVNKCTVYKPNISIYSIYRTPFRKIQPNCICQFTKPENREQFHFTYVLLISIVKTFIQLTQRFCHQALCEYLWQL